MNPRLSDSRAAAERLHAELAKRDLTDPPPYSEDRKAAWRAGYRDAIDDICKHFGSPLDA